jgi:hypothetical protein
MAPPVHSDAEQLERLLLQRCVGRLEAGRDSCVDCGRTPLVGEQVHFYDRVSGVVCELCSALRRDASLSSRRVLHFEHNQTVRLRRITR